jgi:arylsulfatase A-like enzyme
VCVATAAGAPARQNIVFILADDLRWDALSSTGHPFVKTPNIDRLAKEGVRFSNAFVTTPLCLPSRASFLTGQYARRHGVTGNGDHQARSHELVTFPRLLQRAAYRTAFIGKWHIGAEDSPRPGFDRWVSFPGQGKYVHPSLNVDGKKTTVEGYLTDILTDHAVAFVRQPHKTPFLLYLAYTAVHAPFIPAARHKDLFADTPIVRAPSAKGLVEGKPVLRREGIRLSPNDPDVSSTDDLIRNQLRCLAALDEGIGQLLKALEDSNQLDNTIVIFTSDNGYFWGEHGLGGKHGPYEEAIRVPLLMRWPPLIPAGTTQDAFALNVDIAPTLLELAEVPLPKTVHGRSLVPLLKGSGTPWRSSFLTEYFFNPGQTPRFPTWRAVRQGRWMYIEYPTLDGMDELYDVRADPHEMTNLIQRSDVQPVLRELQTELARLVKEAQ